MSDGTVEEGAFDSDDELHGYGRRQVAGKIVQGQFKHGESCGVHQELCEGLDARDPSTWKVSAAEPDEAAKEQAIPCISLQGFVNFL